MLMAELRDKHQWIYNVSIDNYTTPYGTYMVIEISTKNKHIKEAGKQQIVGYIQYFML